MLEVYSVLGQTVNSMKPSMYLESEGCPTATPGSPTYSFSAHQHTTNVEIVQTSSSQNELPNIEFPLFEEATQTAAKFLGIPICFVGLTGKDHLTLKAATGLSELGLINLLARTRRLMLPDPLVNDVLAQMRSLVLPHISAHDPAAQSVLVREYGVQSYLAVPLLTAAGQCVGILAVMDTQPHEFPPHAIAFMELLARWSISEYERQQLAYQVANAAASPATTHTVAESSLLDTVRLTLMSQLTQDMRNPLTTITGMANMLSREIYGPLTPKQREYADIVHNSSQKLLDVANEVLDLGGLDARIQPLNPTSVDIDSIGQYLRHLLAASAERKRQEFRFTVEPSSRLWTLDREVVRQLLYHLVYCIIELSGEGGTIRVHCKERESSLQISAWMTHPWLGEGLPNGLIDVYRRLGDVEAETKLLSTLLARATGRLEATHETQAKDDFQHHPEIVQARETLSLMLCQHLVERHRGTLKLQGSAESGYRCIITLPFLRAATE